MKSTLDFWQKLLRLCKLRECFPLDAGGKSCEIGNEDFDAGTEDNDGAFEEMINQAVLSQSSCRNNAISMMYDK